MRARGATFRRVATAVTLMSALRVGAAPIAHIPFPGLEHGDIREVCGKLRVEDKEDVLEWCTAVFRRVAVVSRLGDALPLLKAVSIRVVSIIKGPEA